MDARTTALVQKSLRRFSTSCSATSTTSSTSVAPSWPRPQLELSSAEVELQELEREEDALRARLAEYTDVDAALEAFTKLRDASRIQLDITRAGKSLVLVIDIEPAP